MEPHIVHHHVDLAAGRLVQQRACLDVLRCLDAKFCPKGLDGGAGVYAILDQQYVPTGDILRQFGQHLDLPRRLRASRVAGDHHEIHPEGKSDRPSQVRVEGEGALQNPDQDQVLLSVISRNLSSQFPDARPHLFLGDDGFAEDAFHAWRHYSFIPLPASVSRHGWSPARPETAHPPDTRPPRRCLPALPPAALRRGAFAEPSDPQRNPAASYDAPAGRSEEHTSELQSQSNLVCRLLLEKKK